MRYAEKIGILFGLSIGFKVEISLETHLYKNKAFINLLSFSIVLGKTCNNHQTKIEIQFRKEMQ